MTILDLVIAPDPLLKEISKEVNPAEINDDLRIFLNNMLETMYEYYGLGLAAVQVGKLKRIIVMDIAQGSLRYDGSHDPNAEPDPIFIINPVITESSNELFVFDEGCLSFPDQFAKIERPKWVKVEYLNEYGEKKTQEFQKLASICIQHEIDHLNGITFVDYLSKMKRDRILQKVKKIKKKLQN